jgi:hypothetical protein
MLVASFKAAQHDAGADREQHSSGEAGRAGL